MVLRIALMVYDVLVGCFSLIERYVATYSDIVNAPGERRWERFNPSSISEEGMIRFGSLESLGH